MYYIVARFGFTKKDFDKYLKNSVSAKKLTLDTKKTPIQHLVFGNEKLSSNYVYATADVSFKQILEAGAAASRGNVYTVWDLTHVEWKSKQPIDRPLVSTKFSKK